MDPLLPRADCSLLAVQGRQLWVQRLLGGGCPKQGPRNYMLVMSCTVCRHTLLASLRELCRMGPSCQRGLLRLLPLLPGACCNSLHLQERRCWVARLLSPQRAQFRKALLLPNPCRDAWLSSHMRLHYVLCLAPHVLLLLLLQVLLARVLLWLHRLC